ncbi:hypothetical protein [Jannaschia rubra]|uniref:Uncharacterized protein n=1 Tax=Jannaschia rubra TaxID=282197 RepID=A0A0M6XS97_9RHOB|nr:hypothetical protein [Jannaschia rubra]CTQ33113.1 hypothetical protein JAN5088_01893 [Jannaschia rubra]SFG73771.1 hypothetical protein SAMN04488517_1137 [Jannaschia rubra]
MIRFLPLVILVAACAELPLAERTISSEARAQPYPMLVPLDPLLVEGARTSAAATVGAPLRVRGAALSRASVPAPVTGDLAARSIALRDRAARLRDAPI